MARKRAVLMPVKASRPTRPERPIRTFSFDPVIDFILAREATCGQGQASASVAAASRSSPPAAALGQVERPLQRHERAASADSTPQGQGMLTRGRARALVASLQNGSVKAGAASKVLHTSAAASCKQKC